MILAVFIALCFFYTPVLADFQISDETIERIDALVSSKIDWSGDTPAYTILIDQGGTTIYEKNIGYADIGNKIPASHDTVYKIGSITKSYTALAILQMVEKGQLNLDATVSQYLADYEGPASEVTVRELLTHTSGIPNYTSIAEAWPFLIWSATNQSEIIGVFKDKPLEFPSGTQFSYSNSGYYLLGMIVESVSKLDYFEYIRTFILKPLKLTATFTGEYEEIVPQQARGYSTTPQGYSNAAPIYHMAPFSAGTIEASAADLVKFRRGIFKGSTTSVKLQALLRQTDNFPDGTQQRYAMGALRVSDFYGHQRWWHSGDTSGFSSQLDFFPQEDITLVILVNTNGAPISPDNLAIKIEREIFSVPQSAETEAQVSEPLLQSYVGEYLMSPFRLMGRYVRIGLRDGILQLQVNDDDEHPVLIPLRARSNNQFVLSVDDELNIRFISEHRKVTGIQLIKAGDVFPGQRWLSSQPR